MAATMPAEEKRLETPVMLGGFAALAEGAWMGVAQAMDVVELARTGIRLARRSLPRASVRGILTREFSVAEASLLLMASFFLSAVLGAGRQILFNAQFGAGMDANAYYAAFRLPDTLFSLIAGGALSSAMIPVLLSTERTDGDASAARLVNLVLTALVAAFVVVVVIGELLAPVFVSHVLAPGFNSQTSQLTVTLTRIMLIQPVILALGSVATAVLNSRNQFLLTALSIASHNIALIGGIEASRLDHHLGIYGPTWGVVVGAVLQVIILLPGLTGRSLRLGLAFDFNDTRLREVIRLLIPNGLAVGVGYAGFIVDTAFASKSPQAAALPALHNAWLLVGLPIALLGQAVGQSAFPRLAAFAAAADWNRMRRDVIRVLAIVVALGVPAFLGLAVLGRPIIRVLFQHGAYGASAGSLTYEVLLPYAIGIPAYVATEVISRGLIALRDTRTPLITNSFQLGGRILLMAILLGELGVRAIPIAFAVMATAETVTMGTILLVKMQRRVRNEPAMVSVGASQV